MMHRASYEGNEEKNGNVNFIYVELQGGYDSPLGKTS